MLISAWLKTLRRNLRPASSVSTPSRRRNSGRKAARVTEDLEVRSLLTTLAAVRPNVGDFLLDGDTRNIAPQELTLQFALSHDVDVASISNQSITVERAGHDGTFGDGNEVPITIGYVGIGSEPNEVVLRFAENLPDDHYRITIHGTGSDVLTFTPRGGGASVPFNGGADDTFNFNLELGAQIIAVDPMPITRDNMGQLQQARDQILLYMSDDELDPVSAEDPAFFQLIFTNDTVTNADDIAHTPTSVVYDPVANTILLTFAADINTLSGAGTYRLRVGTAETLPSAPTQFTPAVDAGSSYATANTQLGILSDPGKTSQIITSAISPQFYPFDFPGNQDEPGHREIEVETHVNSGADGSAAITKLSYNFRDIYGTDPQGNVLHNAITELQKERAREVFEFYSNYLGIDFIETAASGLTIVTGDLRALDPTIPTGPGGVAGLAGGGMAIMDNAESWNDEAGGSWFDVAMHEIGHLLGLGHSYDLPSLTVQGSDGGVGAGRNVSTEPDYPGDADIIHGQFLHRPAANDIDLFQFEVQDAGLFTAEVMAERLANSSQLDSVLRLFRQNTDGTRELLAQNDDYFSEDSYLSLNLQPGIYFIGVTSTGNDAYDPTIADTGLYGTSEGSYQLRVDFRPNSDTAIMDLDSQSAPQALDGDSDGQAGGVYNFWFRAQNAANTLIVDKSAAAGGNGSLATPFRNIK
ncbi:MAG: DVUA0089 family protein, partial [Planctomycetaceae bacterium]|nr:DVUA0089 family protein [Planctomycetaceae bacterium]